MVSAKQNIVTNASSNLALTANLPKNKLLVVGMQIISQAVQGIGTFINLRPAALINTAVR
jgi:hypothetical protein